MRSDDFISRVFRTYYRWVIFVKRALYMKCQIHEEQDLHGAGKKIRLIAYLWAHRTAKNMYNIALMVTCFGSLATISCELRQVRKEATVAVISGAEVRLGQVATQIPESVPGSVILAGISVNRPPLVWRYT